MMKVHLEPARYVIAISGGVDSVVLYDLLAKQVGLELVVAHFDHGMREDSFEDVIFVRQLAEKAGHTFVCAAGALGSQASEAEARQARYAFLRKVAQDQRATAIVTAHHQDDVLETMILNMLRGTNRHGLTSLQNTPSLQRPLVDYPKSDIIKYAQVNNLKWREDSTNLDTTYTRNYIRQRIVPRLGEDGRRQLLACHNQLQKINTELDGMLKELLKKRETPDGLPRVWFNTLAHRQAREVMAIWLRQAGIQGYDRPMLERLVVQAKTLAAGKQADVMRAQRLEIGKTHVRLCK